MEYLLRMKREDSYIKFAHSLSALHVSLGNHCEAANAMLMHARLLSWDRCTVNKNATANTSGGTSANSASNEAIISVGALEAVIGTGDMPDFISEAPGERKVRIYREAIALFERGSNWEQAIALHQDLQIYYKSVTYDFTALAESLRDTATLYTKMKDNERFYPMHFRVGYYGSGFPAEYRNQEFVYRANTLESIMEFTTRTKQKFAGAELLSPKANPQDTHADAVGMHLQISKLTPCELSEMTTSVDDTVDRSHAPKFVRNYHENNEVSCFFYSRPFRKNDEKNRENEFMDLWVERIYLKVAVAFPSTNRREVVTLRSVTILNPVQMAADMVCERNVVLYDNITAAKALADGAADQSFTMALNGVIDAAVNGGTLKFAPFLDGSYVRSNPEIASDVQSTPEKAAVVAKLKVALKEQLELLDGGVRVHSNKCAVAMRPLHDHMSEMFLRMTADLSQLLN
jgi:hypothetical protein